MTTPKRKPGAATGAESAEVRKASNGKGSGAEGKCGKSAEEVRNPCVSSLPAVPPALEGEPMPPAADPAPPLVPARGRKRREKISAPAAFTERDRGRADAARLRDTAYMLERAERELRGLRTSAESYRREAVDVVEVGRRMLAAVADGSFATVRGGYMLNRDARDLVGIHVQAIRAVFQSADVVFDPAKRRADIEKVMAPARQADPAFLRLLNGAASGGALTDE